MSVIVSFCGLVSTLVAIYCSIPYWRSILAGRTKPHQFTWIVFTIMNGIVAISQILAGASYSALISMTFTVGSAVNVVLSFRYGVRDSSRFDRFLFMAAILTIVVWSLTKNNDVAIWLTVVIDVFATAMIVLKIRADHTSEDPRPWCLATTAFTFSILSLAKTSFGILYVRPIYGWLSCMAIIGAVFYYRRSQPNAIAVDIAALSKTSTTVHSRD